MEGYRHHILYAKYHYVRKDVIEDLKVIQGHYTGCGAEHISIGDLQYALINILIKYYHFDSQHHVMEFIDWFKYDNWYDNWDRTYTRVEIERKKLEHFLSMISQLRVKYRNVLTGDWITIIDIGEADSSILPLNKGEKE